jgi:prevent-host-death family protein
VNSLVVSVTEFKAKCLGLIDEISQTGGTITLTKRGRPVATVGPVRKRSWVSPEGAWAGKVCISDEDLTADRSDRWDVLRRKRKA